MKKTVSSVIALLDRRDFRQFSKRSMALLLAVSMMLLTLPFISVSTIYAEDGVTSGSDIVTPADNSDETINNENPDSSTGENTEIPSAKEAVSSSDAPSSIKSAPSSPETNLSSSDAPSALFATAVAPVAEEPLELGAPAITMITGAAAGSSLALTIDGSDLYVDWGDGAPESIVGNGETPINGTVAGRTISIYGSVVSLVADNAQLSSINVSSCPSLQYLYCSNNALTSIDVSSNPNLEDLFVSDNQLSSLDISNNPNLVKLVFSRNMLSSLDISNNPALVYLHCNENAFKISNMPYISNYQEQDDYMYVAQRDIEISSSLKPGDSVDLSSEYSALGYNTVYTWFNADDESDIITPATSENGVFTFSDEDAGKAIRCKMTNSALPALELWTTNTFIKPSSPAIVMTTSSGITFNTQVFANGSIFIDWGDGNVVPLETNDEGYASGTTKGSTVSVYGPITYFAAEGNSLTSIDVSNCTDLEALFCGDNQLTSLDITNNAKLSCLYCGTNQLTSLDTSGNPELAELLCSENLISELDLSANNISILHCNVNSFKFSTLTYSAGDIDEYMYDSQADLEIPESIQTGETLDLSSEAVFNGVNTVYTWYNTTDDSVVTPASASNGVFIFGENAADKTLYCILTNSNLPDLALRTTEIAVISTLIVDDSTSDALGVEVDEKFDCVDENNDPIDVGGLKLIVGNVDESNKKTVLDAVEYYNEEFGVEQDNYAMYDISLVDKDSHAKVDIVDGQVKITLKIPENFPGNNKNYTFKLFHYKDDGTVEEIPIQVSNSHYSFFADDFSPYVLVWVEKENTENEDNPSGGSTSDPSGSTTTTTTTTATTTASGTNKVNGSSDTPDTGDDTSDVAITMVANLMFFSMMAMIYFVRRRRTAQVECNLSEIFGFDADFDDDM